MKEFYLIFIPVLVLIHSSCENKKTQREEIVRDEIIEQKVHIKDDPDELIQNKDTPLDKLGNVSNLDKIKGFKRLKLGKLFNELDWKFRYDHLWKKYDEYMWVIDTISNSKGMYICSKKWREDDKKPVIGSIPVFKISLSFYADSLVGIELNTKNSTGTSSGLIEQGIQNRNIESYTDIFKENSLDEILIGAFGLPSRRDEGINPLKVYLKELKIESPSSIATIGIHEDNKKEGTLGFYSRYPSNQPIYKNLFWQTKGLYAKYIYCYYTTGEPISMYNYLQTYTIGYNGFDTLLQSAKIDKETNVRSEKLEKGELKKQDKLNDAANDL